MSFTTRTRSAMNNMYRSTRHIYDITRKYYLLGRDTLIKNLNAKPNEYICEIGCGTARNLIKLKHAYPQSYFYGLDASDEMLKTAKKSIGSMDIEIQQAFAQNFDPKHIFGLKEPFTKFIFSYSLSIIPPWKKSIDHALSLLPIGGEIHIVDFGGQNGLPPVFRKFIFWWLKIFHVKHKPQILAHLKKLEKDGKGALSVQQLYKGYAYLAVFTKS